MSDWIYGQTDPTDRLAKLQHFSMVKKGVDGVEREFFITVREYITPKDPEMKFYACADRQTNQNAAPFTPCGWGPTLLTALAECVTAIHRFPDAGCD